MALTRSHPEASPQFLLLLDLSRGCSPVDPCACLQTSRVRKQPQGARSYALGL